jgi:hypothetical protein
MLPERITPAADAHLLPYHHPPELAPRSDTQELAGELGFVPLRLNLSQEYLRDHWAPVVHGAKRVGCVANRQDWRDECSAWSASQQALIEDVLLRINRSAAA